MGEHPGHQSSPGLGLSACYYYMLWLWEQPVLDLV
jgi:hypothetical protein